MTLDIKTLEKWLWDAACSIRGEIDAPAGIANNSILIAMQNLAKEDFNIAPIAETIPSEFVKVMEESQLILKALEKKKFSKIKKMLLIDNMSLVYPKSIDELQFGDSMIRTT